MRLFRYKNGINLKRKNKRIRLMTNDKGYNFLELEIFSKQEGCFARTFERLGLKNVTIQLTDETLELLSCVIIDHLNRKKL